jgi:hypothetical protein
MSAERGDVEVISAHADAPTSRATVGTLYQNSEGATSHNGEEKFLLTKT